MWRRMRESFKDSHSERFEHSSCPRASTRSSIDYEEISSDKLFLELTKGEIQSQFNHSYHNLSGTGLFFEQGDMASPTYDSTPDSGVHEDTAYTDPEELKQELARTEEEILTLRQVLTVKVKHAHELKRKLGITPWKEFRDDMEQGLKNVKESPAYLKTNMAIKTAGEKTTTAIHTIGQSVSKKLGEVKNSTAFKSFEEKVGSAYTNVKGSYAGRRNSQAKVTGHRGEGDLEGDLNSNDSTSQKSSPAVTPTATPTETPATTPAVTPAAAPKAAVGDPRYDFL